jgi:hypothetical protein
MGGQAAGWGADHLNVSTNLTFAPEDPMHLLEHGLPLTLLLDLADPQGPRSADILAYETSGSWEFGAEHA